MTWKELQRSSQEDPETHTMGAYSNSYSLNHRLFLSHTNTHTHKCNCPVMQRESVSEDKAISRSEYRQTEGIVLHSDTQPTHPQTNAEMQQKIGKDRKEERALDLRVNVQVGHTERQFRLFKKIS